MNGFVERLKKQNFQFFGPVDEETISKAEFELGVTFSEEYREYVKEYGAGSVDYHELTGICTSKRLNVIDVTKKCRTEEIPANWYVIEEVNIDDVVYWQDREGNVYETIHGRAGVKVAPSLTEYLLTE